MITKIKNNIYNNNKGPLGLPFLYSTKRIQGSLVRGAEIIRSQRGNPLRSPLRKVWALPPRNAQYDASLLVTHMQDILRPFVGRRNFTAMLTCGWNRCCRWHCKLNKM